MPKVDPFEMPGFEDMLDAHTRIYDRNQDGRFKLGTLESMDYIVQARQKLADEGADDLTVELVESLASDCVRALCRFMAVPEINGGSNA